MESDPELRQIVDKNDYSRFQAVMWNITIQIKFLEMKPTMCKIKNALYRINGRADITED